MSKNDPKTLSLNTVDYPFETLVARVTANPPKLILDPDFQRKFKWDKEGWDRSSKFIESCLMRIPLPSCYFAEMDDGRQLVIDGVQRITTICKFMNDDFALSGLETLSHLNGKKFSDLTSEARDLESTTIRCIVLRRENPEEIVAEIFSRLNQGGVDLSDQEIRHALFPGKFNDLLSELAETKEVKNFKIGKRSSARNDSLEGEELVLRFFAMNNDLKSYEGNLKSFLDRFMKTHKGDGAAEVKRFRSEFVAALDRCKIVFGGDNELFTSLSGQRRRQGLVYFDLQMSTLSAFSKRDLRAHKTAIRDAWEEMCSSREFKRLTEGGVQRKSSVGLRNKIWKEKLDSIVP
ncbi:DUF262 domain-containing protein [Ruegeria halocynthiae]|uniref:DUF262 domain-containing protein n=1 Tax=Ruegeria halocynthiae TaxID=985054 RepID=UPI00055FBF08|nr:DUF262 domain-containing protein [Ruegeria halocynthiae]